VVATETYLRKAATWRVWNCVWTQVHSKESYDVGSHKQWPGTTETNKAIVRRLVDAINWGRSCNRGRSWDDFGGAEDGEVTTMCYLVFVYTNQKMSFGGIGLTGKEPRQ
jgi:hypothetical protein